ncbi:hypothetical protein [Actinoallomurus liliacearum]|uniref:hypothetical protein n=1 Tax=Actinoallomurus liliacearum TaxID=1080073 RepID=UPI0031EEC83E
MTLLAAGLPHIQGLPTDTAKRSALVSALALEAATFLEQGADRQVRMLPGRGPVDPADHRGLIQRLRVGSIQISRSTTSTRPRSNLSH